ncbi:MAG: ATP-dependent DNA helicase [Pseudomonadales bacterium]|nr:ATP-dependent DNA helicase [Pseudomonadales bacterium]
MSELADIFNERLPALIENFVVREQQVKFAESIASIISGGGNGLIEAGTGIGKTFGYLIPVMQSGDTAIVSTGTRNLQDQLFLNDLPKLAELFPGKRLSLLKGRANYLCVHRRRASLKVVAKGENLDRLVQVRGWSSQTKTGDLTELLDPEEHPEIMRLVTSTRDNCLGGRCPDFDQCSLYLARDKAAQSDLVVVNHHLLFADLAQQEDALQSLLPRAGIVLVDEAHRVPDVARQFFGQQLSSGQMVELIRDTATELALLGNDDPMARQAISELQAALDRLRDEIMASDIVDYSGWLQERSTASVVNLDLALNELISHLDRVAQRSVGLQQVLKRSLRLADLFTLLSEDLSGDKEHVHWLDRRENSFSINLSPVSIAEPLRRIVQNPEVSWIFTSATLSLDSGFNHIQGAVGLESAECLRFGSPFDYRTAVRAWLPDQLPAPGGEAHTRALVEAVVPLIPSNPGRTLFLFTSYRAVRHAALMLSGIARPLLVQGSMSRLRLTRAFVETPGAVLLATQSFWEGVDFRGADLRCLIIDKLPFPNPAEPLYAADADRIAKGGGDSFTELALPRTVLALKQGFGRLIRQESDRGLFVLGDSRLRNRDYRHFILGNLPEMMWLESCEDATAWLRTL